MAKTLHMPAEGPRSHRDAAARSGFGLFLVENDAGHMHVDLGHGLAGHRLHRNFDAVLDLPRHILDPDAQAEIDIDIDTGLVFIVEDLDRFGGGGACLLYTSGDRQHDRPAAPQMGFNGQGHR